MTNQKDKLENFFKVGDIIFPHPSYSSINGVRLDPIPIFYRDGKLCCRACPIEQSAFYVDEVKIKLQNAFKFVAVSPAYRGKAITVFVQGNPKIKIKNNELEKDSALKVVKVRPRSVDAVEVKFNIKGL